MKCTSSILPMSYVWSTNTPYSAHNGYLTNKVLVHSIVCPWCLYRVDWLSLNTCNVMTMCSNSSNSIEAIETFHVSDCHVIATKRNCPIQMQNESNQTLFGRKAIRAIPIPGKRRRDSVFRLVGIVNGHSLQSRVFRERDEWRTTLISLSFCWH